MRSLRIVGAFAFAALSLIAFAQPAAAHERRTVGPYQLVVGFVAEPAFLGVQNGVSLAVTDTRSSKPVEGLEKTLSVEIFAGGLSTPLALPLQTRFGLPGSYAAYFIPTKEGAYRFHLKGKVDATDLNEQFESGPGRFDEVKAVAPLQYPERVPAGADLSRTLAELRSTADQVRVLAIAALVLAVAAIALPLARRR